MYLNQGAYKGIRLLSRTTVDLILRNQIGNIWGEDSETQGPVKDDTSWKFRQLVFQTLDD